MSEPGHEFVEVFLQEASDHLQYLREYSGILQDTNPSSEELERLYIAAHTLAGSSASYGYPLFAEIASKVAHIFQYALNAGLGADLHGPLVEFLSDAISVMESDLLLISSNGVEAGGEIEAFKQRYAFAFQPAALAAPAEAEPAAEETGVAPAPPAMFFDDLPGDDEVPHEVLEFFVPEADEHLQSVTESLLALETNPDPQEIHKLFRAMHTVKGSAAQVGLRRISAIAHRVEDLIGRLRDGALQPAADIIDLCLESVDILKKFLHRQWPDESVMQASVEYLLARLADLVPEEPAEPETQASEAGSEAVAAEGARPAAPGALVAGDSAGAAGRAAAAAPSAVKSVRIALDRLDRMMNTVGELVINRTRMVGRLAELNKLVDILNFSKSRLLGKVFEFQEKHEFSRIDANSGASPTAGRSFVYGDAARTPLSNHPLSDFSELEMDRYDDFNILSRSLTEISADVTEVVNQLNTFMGRVDADIDEFTKLAHSLQDEITQARMVPIGTLYTRLSRTVRDAAKETGKQVELVLEGADTQLDNNIIQQVSDPLIHLVRNAVAHGVEPPDERVRAGKPERGQVAVRAYHRGNHIFVEVEDDGGGIDYERVRASVAEAGLVSAEEAARLSERDLQAFLFRPGISTAPLQTELAGRGVGLDVVRANLNALNGDIEVRSQDGRGTCFTLKVPLTLIISQALFVRCGTMIFALPLMLVEEIRRIRPEEIEDVGGKLLTKVRDVITEVVRLDTKLSLAPLEPTNGYFRLVIVRAGNRQAGLVVEEILGKDEIVIKSLGEYLRRVKLFPGATIAPDGSLILLLDLNRLAASEAHERHVVTPSASAARVFAPGAAAVAAGSIPAEAIDAVPSEKVVLVADDSVSVRKFVGRMLERAGYRVKLASDGLEAAEIVAQTGCHLIITDIEMPRMNGYELMAHLRQSAATRRIPVLVVTSRAGAKHRDRAMKEGAADFLTKPVQEEQLLAAVGQMIGLSAAASRMTPVGSGRAPVAR